MIALQSSFFCFCSVLYSDNFSTDAQIDARLPDSLVKCGD